MRVVRILPQDTYPIRNLILRPNCPIESCHFPGDMDEKTFHLGAMVDKKLVSVASFYFDKHPDLPGHYQYRLRGMATLPGHRGQGYSSSLLKTAFPVIANNQCNLLWCNARESAIGFYLSVGLTPVGEIFNIESIGPHQLMYKELSL